MFLALFLFSRVCVQEPAAEIGIRFHQNLRLACCLAMTEVELNPAELPSQQFKQLREQVPEFAVICLAQAFLLQSILWSVDSVKAASLFKPPRIELTSFREEELTRSQEYHAVCSERKLDGQLVLDAPVKQS